MAERPTITDRLAAFGARVALGLFGLLPLDRASALGGWIGRHLGPHFKAHRYALRNIARALPDLGPERHAAIAAGMWDNLGRVVGEYAHLRDITIAMPGSPGRVEFVGLEHLLSLRESARPAIFFSGHYGNWELTCLAAAHVGLPMLNVYRAANNPLVDDMLQKLRGRVSGSYVPKGSRAARAIYAALKRNEHVAMLVDQKLNTGLAVPFFGRDAMTTPALAEFALRFGCPVFPAFVQRLEGAHFRLTVEAPITFAQTGDHDADVYAATLTMNQKLEDWIRAHPDQWFWVHKRWPKD